MELLLPSPSCSLCLAVPRLMTIKLMTDGVATYSGGEPTKKLLLLYSWARRRKMKMVRSVCRFSLPYWISGASSAIRVAMGMPRDLTTIYVGIVGVRLVASGTECWSGGSFVPLTGRMFFRVPWRSVVYEL